MARRGDRDRLWRGVFKDATGIAIIVSVRGKPKEHRYPLSTPHSVLKDEQKRLEDAKIRFSRTGRGTLAHDVERYLARVTHLARQTGVRAEARAWSTLYPKLARHAVSRERVLDARTLWIQQGLSPKTINNRVDRLRRIYRELDGGKGAWTPADALRPLQVERTPIVRTTADLVNTVCDNLLEAAKSWPGHMKHRARLMVIAVHGRRPSEIARAKKDDVNLDARVWVPRDGKGGWTEGLYLNDEQLVAWRAMFEADAFGPFDESKWVQVLKSHGWPVVDHPTKRRKDGSPYQIAHPRPYQLRHTTGITLSEAGIDLADVAPQMGHKRIETTRKHYTPVLNSRMQKASEAIEGRFGWATGAMDRAMGSLLFWGILLTLTRRELVSTVESRRIS